MFLQVRDLNHHVCWRMLFFRLDSLICISLISISLAQKKNHLVLLQQLITFYLPFHKHFSLVCSLLYSFVPVLLLLQSDCLVVNEVTISNEKKSKSFCILSLSLDFIGIPFLQIKSDESFVSSTQHPTAASATGQAVFNDWLIYIKEVSHENYFSASIHSCHFHFANTTNGFDIQN